MDGRERLHADSLSDDQIEILNASYSAGLDDGEDVELEASGVVATMREEGALEALRQKKIARLCNGDYELQAKAIQAGWSADRTELEVLRSNRPAGHFVSRADSGVDDTKLIQASFMARAGHEELAVKQFGEQAVEEGKSRFRSILEAAQHIAEMNGHYERDKTRILSASFTSSTFNLPLLMGDTLHRMVEALYRETPATWRSFAAIRAAKDFRLNRSIRPSFIGELELLPEDGEIKHGSMEEDDPIVWSVDQYAKQFAVGRKSLINDDLNVFDEIPTFLSRAAMRALSDLVWQTLLSASYDNELSGAGSVLSLTSLQTAVTTMRTQRNSEGHDLDIMPKTLVVPPELETTARQILESVELQTIAGTDQTATETRTTANALKSIAKLEVEPRISNPRFENASETQWFLFGGPMDLPAVVGYLEEKPTPAVEYFGMDQYPNNLGVSFRCYHDFGCTIGDTKASVHSLGA